MTVPATGNIEAINQEAVGGPEVVQPMEANQS